MGAAGLVEEGEAIFCLFFSSDFIFEELFCLEEFSFGLLDYFSELICSLSFEGYSG